MSSGHDLRTRLPLDFTTGRDQEIDYFADFSFFIRLAPAAGLRMQIKN
jgi:hypothetical protein